MNKNKILIYVLIATLLFLAMPAVSAHIDIIDVGHNNAAQWEDIETMAGYVDYQNIANHTVAGAIFVFVDGDIVAGKLLDMPIRYLGGFRCSPVKTLEFPINEAKGEHTIVVHIYSMNSSAERTYEYHAKGIEENITEEAESEEVEDWLKCWSCEE